MPESWPTPDTMCTKINLSIFEIRNLLGYIYEFDQTLEIGFDQKMNQIKNDLESTLPFLMDEVKYESRDDN